MQTLLAALARQRQRLQHGDDEPLIKQPPQVAATIFDGTVSIRAWARRSGLDLSSRAPRKLALLPRLGDGHD